MNPSTQVVFPLHQRMIEDMRLRKLNGKTQMAMSAACGAWLGSCAARRTRPRGRQTSLFFDSKAHPQLKNGSPHLSFGATASTPQKRCDR